MSKKYLITGGAGFIGSNYVHRLLKRGEEVVVFDNLSRSGSRKNLEWLINEFGQDSFELVQADIRDSNAIRKTAKDADIIVHLAAQVAVTTSVENPRDDFEVNALGTFNVLEAARLSGKKPQIIYASTNKVYGGMENVTVVEAENNYFYRDFPEGISEEQPLDFHSPYGCSKGAGDQYVCDYAKIYDLPTTVMRQSCIYGPRQFGIEDQGWVAWFVIAAIFNKPITIFGDGKQVRDLLFIDDLLDAYDSVLENPKGAFGQVFNLGGGSKNVMSVWKEFGPILTELLGRKVPVKTGGWRPGDQRIYVSDIRKANRILNWNPQITVQEGIKRLYNWVLENQGLFQG
jgi:CDP-paratose 2-epimerase